MTKTINIRTSTVFAILLLQVTFIFAQTSTTVNGKVIDKKTKEALPFVNVYFEGRNIGTITDNNGYYMITTKEATPQLSASFMGYYPQTKNVITGKKQTINFELSPENISLNEVIVQSKKKRYRNKNNPAVELMRNVIAHKKRTKRKISVITNITNTKRSSSTSTT